MRLVRGDDGKVRFAIAAEKVPANRGREVYAVWFTKRGQPRRAGSASPRRRWARTACSRPPARRSGTRTRSRRWFATYEKVLITRETDASRASPGPAVLEGSLPAAAG